MVAYYAAYLDTMPVAKVLILPWQGSDSIEVILVLVASGETHLSGVVTVKPWHITHARLVVGKLDICFP